MARDGNGNIHVAPISMGTAMWGHPADCGWYYCFAVQNRRQIRSNLAVDCKVANALEN
ncbi:MAG: hypothetical protein AB7C89_01020 [Intestinibacillus sp.]